MFRVKRKSYAPKLGFLKSKRIWILFLIIIIILAVVLYNSSLLKIKKIVISPSNLSCANQNQILQSLNLLNKNILTINETQLDKKLKSQFLCIERVSFKKTIPNNLAINISERSAAVVISLLPTKQLNLDTTEATSSTQEAKLDFSVSESSSSTKYLVSRDGLIFAKWIDGDVVSVPIIYIVDPNLGLAKTIPENITEKILGVLKKLTELQIEIKSVKIDSNKLLIDGVPRLIFSLKKDLNVQFASLQLILQQAKMNSKGLEQIDLRFDKPVIIYSAKSH